MTLGEIKLIFRTADKNKDNKVSMEEWGEFHGLFVLPFEEVDQRGEYWLDAGDVALALDPEADPSWMAGIVYEVTDETLPLMIE